VPSRLHWSCPCRQALNAAAVASIVAPASATAWAPPSDHERLPKIPRPPLAPTAPAPRRRKLHRGHQSGAPPTATTGRLSTQTNPEFGPRAPLHLLAPYPDQPRRRPRPEFHRSRADRSARGHITRPPFFLRAKPQIKGLVVKPREAQGP
jgi:hypothetical protein